MAEAWLVGLALLIAVPWMEQRWARRDERRHAADPVSAAEAIRRRYELSTRSFNAPELRAPEAPDSLNHSRS